MSIRDFSTKDSKSHSSENDQTSRNPTAESEFVQQLRHEMNRIRDIIKKPKLVESKFSTLIGIHESIETMINEYVKASADEIRVEVEDILKKWCSKFKTEWKDDVNKLDELNAEILKWKLNGNGKESKNIKVPAWDNVVKNIIEKVNTEVELFDESIYGELNEYVDVNLKKDDLEKKEVKEMVKMYNELREEIEDGLDDAIKDVMNMEKKWMNIRRKLEDKGKKWLEVLYVCHLNYLKSVMKKESCSLNVNGKVIEGKQTDWLKNWLDGKF